MDRNGLTRGGFQRWILAFLAIGMTGVGLVAPAAAHEAHGHPAKLHEGTCDVLGRVAFSLNGVGGEVDLAGTPVPTGEAVNPDRAYQVMRSVTDLDASLDDLLAAPHALMVYESDEDLTAISCGNLGGNRLADELAVGLAEIGVPGHTGIALFEGNGETTTVRIFLGHALSPVSAAGAAASPEQAAADAPDENEGHGDNDTATPDADA